MREIVDEHYDEVLTYTRDSVKLVVEQQENSLVITYANLTVEDTYHLLINLVGQLSRKTGQSYNDSLDDLRDIEEDM